MDQLHVLLYVSRLATDAAGDAVQRIAQESRNNNARDDITGLLAFDGVTFTQYVEGPLEAVDRLLSRLKEDWRHEDMEVLHRGESTSRRFPGWRLGYLRLDLQEFGIASLRRMRGATAVEAFTFILLALDFDVGQAQPERL
jgi:hypothetical protein